MQYRETAFNFVSRLMEAYGIFYFFRHDDGKHTLVLGDDENRYNRTRATNHLSPRLFCRAVNRITDWQHQFEYRPGKWCHSDYSFEAPRLDLKADIKTVVNLPNNKQYEIFDYPGEFVDRSDGEALVRVRMEEEEVPYDVVNGIEPLPQFHAGREVPGTGPYLSGGEGPGLRGYRRDAQRRRGRLYDRRDALGPGLREQVHLHARQRALSAGTDTAKTGRATPQPPSCVGPPGEEIYPDKYGRVKVQFFWDRYGEKDDKSSCWIRVSQTPPARLGPHGHSAGGRGGIVNFLEGDPDRPIITGRVYNAADIAPFALPGGKTRRGNTTKTYKGGGFNKMTSTTRPGRSRSEFTGSTTWTRWWKTTETLKVEVNRMLNIGNDKSATRQRSNRERGQQQSGYDWLQSAGQRRGQSGNHGRKQYRHQGGHVDHAAMRGCIAFHINQAGVITITGTLLPSAARSSSISQRRSRRPRVCLSPAPAVASITTGAALNQQLGGTMNVHGADTTVNGGVTNVKGGVTNVQGGTVNIN